MKRRSESFLEEVAKNNIEKGFFSYLIQTSPIYGIKNLKMRMNDMQCHQKHGSAFD